MTEPTEKMFDGNYLIYRKKGGGLATGVGGGKLPYFRHKTLESAITEAKRLSKMFPLSTFIIMQEIGTVKIRRE